MLAIATVCELYRVDSDAVMAGSERLLQFGGVGTPLLGEFVLGAIGPQATNAAGLDADAADWVDTQVAVALAYQPIGRVLGQVAGWVVQADPALAAEREAEKAASRYVRFSDLIDGHTDLWGRLDAADGIALDQALDTVADDLADAGVAGGRDVLRSTALGVLARTALGQDPLGLAAARGQALHGISPEFAAWSDTDRAQGARNLATAGPIECGTPASTNPSRDKPANPTTGSTVREPRRAVLHIHLNPDAITDGVGVATIDGWGPLLTDRLGELLDGCKVTVRPVIDLNQTPAVDSYEIPDRLRQAVCARNPVDVFPYGTRRAESCDLDHRDPYVRGGPPGQTSLENLAPLSRRTHRLKHQARWKLYAHPIPGYHHWKSPSGFEYLVGPDGTTQIGRPDWHDPDWIDPAWIHFDDEFDWMLAESAS